MASLPYLITLVNANPSVFLVNCFIASSVAMVSIMGGVYAVLPAYESDIFGSKYVASNHGRMLLASTLAAFAGPQIILKSHKYASDSAIRELVKKADPEAFFHKFGQDVDKLEELIKNKSVSIQKVLDILPSDTIDPTPFLYNNGLMAITGLMGVGCVAHTLV